MHLTLPEGLSLVTALFGSAGLVSAVTSLLTWARQSRIRRFLDDSKVARDVLPPDSHASRVLDQAIATATLRLSLPVFRRRSAAERAVSVFACLAFALMTAGLLFLSFMGVASSNGDEASIGRWVGAALIWIVYVGVAGTMLFYVEQHYRDRLVYQQLVEIENVVETAELHRAKLSVAKSRRRKRKADAVRAAYLDRKWARARRTIVSRSS